MTATGSNLPIKCSVLLFLLFLFFLFFLSFRFYSFTIHCLTGWKGVAILTKEKGEEKEEEGEENDDENGDEQGCISAPARRPPFLRRSVLAVLVVLVVLVVLLVLLVLLVAVAVALSLLLAKSFVQNQTSIPTGIPLS